MSSRGKSWSKAAVCPRPEHAGSRVRFDGHYGAPGHRRQYYRCIPANGDRPHRFTEVLPREESWHDACELCERDVGFHEGPHAARKYQFVARGIAEALVAVGAGSSYRDAALVARERARRLRADPETGQLRFTRHGSLVMDWVEIFAPVVFEAHRPPPGRPAARCCSTTCRSGSAIPTPAATGSRSASSARWATSAGAPSCGAWRRSRASRSLTGRRSSAPWMAPRRGSCATTTPASRTRFVPPSPTPSCTCASGTCATRSSD